MSMTEHPHASLADFSGSVLAVHLFQKPPSLLENMCLINACEKL